MLGWDGASGCVTPDLDGSLATGHGERVGEAAARTAFCLNGADRCRVGRHESEAEGWALFLQRVR